MTRKSEELVEEKSIDSLAASDLRTHPVWQYVNDRAGDRVLVRPVRRLPVSKLAGKVVGVQVELANGEHVWALIGNVDPESPKLTGHFLTLSVLRDDHWFALARYHDFNCETQGPDALARFLGLQLDEVFPIRYDISEHVKGDGEALIGVVEAEPSERLSRAEIIALAVPRP